MLLIGNSSEDFPFRYEIPDYDIRGQAWLGLLALSIWLLFAGGEKVSPL